MFEKDAEEIANKRCHEIMCYGHCSFSSPKHHRCGEWHREYECALKGAEFGYNKANEWHYVKDELPEKQYDKVFVTIAYLNAFKNPCKKDCFYDGKDFVYWDSGKNVGWKKADIFGKIYAWKYADDFIPELPKESE